MRDGNAQSDRKRQPDGFSVTDSERNSDRQSESDRFAFTHGIGNSDRKSESDRFSVADGKPQPNRFAFAFAATSAIVYG